MSRRMIPQKDQDYIEVLSTALTADIVGDVKVYQNVEVDSNVQVDSNVEVAGDLHVSGNVKYKQAVIPAYPTTAGTYVLKLTVDANGDPTFAWIAA